jgi:hypothetical protein
MPEPVANEYSRDVASSVGCSAKPRPSKLCSAAPEIRRISGSSLPPSPAGRRPAAVTTVGSASDEAEEWSEAHLPLKFPTGHSSLMW